jgi:hypothetical protein
MNNSYLNERIFNTLGLTGQQCLVKLKTFKGLDEVPIFSEDREGNIRIIMYDLRRNIIEIENDEKHQAEDASGISHGKTAYLTRLRPEYLAEHPDSPKYRMNAGERTRPFFRLL